MLSDSDYEYRVSDYPPFVCISKDIEYMVPISMLLVLNVLFAIGTSLFIPMLWVIHKVLIRAMENVFEGWLLVTFYVYVPILVWIMDTKFSNFL